MCTAVISKRWPAGPSGRDACLDTPLGVVLARPPRGGYGLLDTPVGVAPGC